MKHTAIIIPVRYASTRFPGKPLARIRNKYLIEHVVERIKGSKASEIIVATDHELIRDVIESVGGCRVVMTRPGHNCGTDRIAEVAQQVDSDYIINVQGDQLIPGPQMIDDIISGIDEKLEMATLYTDISTDNELLDINVVKVVTSLTGNIIYMSRSPIPFDRGQFDKPVRYYKQVGIYVFKRKSLLNFSTCIKPSDLEIIEGIELLRALCHDIPLAGIHTSSPLVDVNVPDDITLAEKFIQEYPFLQGVQHD